MRVKHRIMVLSTLIILFNILAVASLDRALGCAHGLNQQSSSDAIQRKPGADAGEDILEPGRTINRELAAEQQHIYRINLAANQFLRAIVEQDGIDVVVRLSGPDGKQIMEFDSESRPRGQETVTLVAEAAGEHRLTVQPRQKGAAAGGYEIRIEKLRPATDDDRALQEAHKLIEESLKLHRAGRFDQAVSPVERALAIRQRVLGPEDPSVAHPLNNLARLHHDKGDYANAEPLFIRALGIREKALGPEHPDVAKTLDNLATLYLNKGAYAKAEELYRRALSIFEKALDPQHLMVGGTLNNLGVLYRNTGDYAKAEPFLQRAVSIWEKAVGPQQPEVALALNNLARLYDYKGDYLKAEALFKRALTIREKSLGADHPLVAGSLVYLASFYSDRGDYAQAEPLLQRALPIWEKAGPEHPEVANSSNSLAMLYLIRGDYAKAEPLLQRALSIWEKTQGPEHRNVAAALSNLSNLYQNKGDYAKAEAFIERALAIFEKAMGPEHPDVAEALDTLAALSAVKGDLVRAISFQLRANAISERNLALNLAAGSERQKLAYLSLLSRQTDFTFSLHSQAAPDDPQALNLAFTTLLRRKGRGLEAMVDMVANLRRRVTPEDQKIFDQIVVLRSQLAALTLREAGAAGPETYRARIRPLEDEIEELEAKISSRSAEFRAQSQPIALDAVQAALPEGAALIEFVVHTPQDIQTGKPKPPRYLAYLLVEQGRPRWVDLGEVGAIDHAIGLWRGALRDPKRTDTKRLARIVDERVMRPARSLLNEMPGETRRLLIAPDGALNLIPFAALVDELHRYLVERYAISYLTSGRDLLRLQTSESSKNAPLVLANPLFGRAAAVAAHIDQHLGSPRKQAGDQGQARVNPGRIFFQSLPGTKHEALAIKALLSDAVVLVREEATEAALKKARAPRILHIATHGFFFNNQEPPSAEIRGGSGGRNPSASNQRFDNGTARIENPLLRSGLALAGVNEHRGGDDDGLLTAMEAASLNLWGTRLVTLSACDTGVGEVKNGEGVYGLRRALTLAGSETQVMSLWPVSDRETRSFMAGYYGRLLRGEGRGEALRQIQLEMLKDAKLRHPYYWANFIQAGDWSSLDGHSER
ncbi:MAG TPA: CHAT domain-containing tetratricopeptide repeat protein [Blastocatellia bacterium]|nr:CHAT domain-containing tetratricopeptide repeat protein [Blastocatellia bacterium]